MSNESGFPLVSILDSDVIVSPLDIELHVDLSILDFVNEVGDKGKWMCIFGGVFIEISVILTGSKTAILFSNKER